MPLEARKVSYRYGRGDWVLRGASLSVSPGEVVGLRGESGSGKTTFARIIAGYLHPQEGAVLLDGKPLPRGCYNPVQLMHQHPERAVNPRWRMRDTLNEAWEVDEVTLEELGVETSWLGRWPNELSGGELQRICLARALGPETRFLIADEITTMLDAVTQAQIWRAILARVKERGLGVLAVSHDASLLERVADRVVVVEEMMVQPTETRPGDAGERLSAG
ncbi:MAG: ATP-binding cassette domain-containing protein [Actinobacteria bacterium]|nr:ATP-binding cassette domain-containing protein [Actinomycetota bacterium]MDI6831679.1 ATP-binding cassette domain-containing protein [Actinomycetota bacterium]